MDEVKRGSTFFENEIFDGVDFSRCCIIGVYFQNCSFRRTNLSGADLSYSRFVGCDFYEANFSEACLYTARLIDCDLTKSDFAGALLNGVRVKDANITHTVFGTSLATGHNRKRATKYKEESDHWICDTFDKIPRISNLEADYCGIACPSTQISIGFARETELQNWRDHRRKSEVAKTIELLLVANGYTDISDDYSYLFRYHKTRSNRYKSKKIMSIVLREKISGYGVRLKNPLMTWIYMVLFFGLMYPALPIIFSGSGLDMGSAGLLQYKSNWNSILMSLVEATEYSLKVSSLSIYDNPKAVGMARLFALTQTILSVALVGVGLSVIARRSGVH